MVLFCSKDCQMKSWNDHKKDCKSFKNFVKNEQKRISSSSLKSLKKEDTTKKKKKKKKKKKSDKSDKSDK